MIYWSLFTLIWRCIYSNQLDLNICGVQTVRMSQFMLKCVICVLLLKIVNSQNLENIFADGDLFFKNIRKKYENTELTENVKLLIDEEVNHYVNIVSRQLYVDHSRKKSKDLNIKSSGGEVFNSIQEIFQLDLSNIRDIKLFKYTSEYEQWFGVTLNATNMVIHEIKGEKFVPIISCPVQGASKIHVGQFYSYVVIVVQQLQCIKVFGFDIENRHYLIKEIQNINLLDIKDVAFLSASNQLILGIASSTVIQPYYWQDGVFVALPYLTYPANRLRLWQLGKSIMLAASSSSQSWLFEYSDTLRRFVPIQSLNSGFLDATLTDHPKSEALLVLTGLKYSAVYRRLDHFAPFQQLGPADQLLVYPVKETLLLLLLKDNVLYVYQYDGWKFVCLNFQLLGVREVQSVVLRDERLLFIKWFDASWSLNRIIFMKKKDPAVILDKLRVWSAKAVEKAKQYLGPDFKIKSQITLSKEQVPSLRVKNINGFNIDKLKNLMGRYERLMHRVAEANDALDRITPKGVLHLSSLKAHRGRVQCHGKCNAENLVAKLKCNNFSKLQRINDTTQSIKLEHVRVLNELKDFPCPVPGVRLLEVDVKGSVNGASLADLKENVLLTSRDQTITGELTFAELHASKLFASNFDAASSRTRQRLRASQIRTSELDMRTGGLLLPLDGAPVVASGKLVAKRARFAGLVHLRGHIGGRAGRKTLPSVHYTGHHRLQGDYVLEAARVTELIAAGELTRSRGPSLADIAKRVLPIDAEVIPVKMIFARNSPEWTNITLNEKLPRWLTRKNPDLIRVTGKKIAQMDVKLPASLYSTLPPLKISSHLCTAGAIASDIRSSVVDVGTTTAKIVESEEIIGAKDLCNTLKDSVTTLNEVDLSRKSFVGTVYVDDLNINDIENSPFHGISKAQFEWYRPDVVKGSFKLDNLKVNSLNVMEGIKIPFPDSLENMIIEGNLNVKTINKIYLDSFAKNIVTVDNVTSLKNVTFVHLEVDEIDTLDTNIELQKFTDNIFLGNKTIVGNVDIVEDFSVPNLLSFPYKNENVTYVVEGSIQFKNEPYVEKLNGKNISKLLTNIWTIDRPANLTGNIVFENITLTQPLEQYDLMYTPTFGSWKSFEKRLLSKTKSQNINVPIHFVNAKASNIISQTNATFRSSDLYLNDLLNNSVKSIANQTIKEKWRIDKLTIEGDMVLCGKMNKLNLSTDVARQGGKNVVTGIKVVNEMSVQNLAGLNFSQWAEDAVVLTDPKKPIKITGKKTFDDFYARVLHLSGRINNKRLDNFLLKTSDQVITGSKVIKGSVYVSSLAVDGLINDINMTDFTFERLKKHEPIQKFNSEILIKGNLQILGNVTVSKKFHGVELKKKDRTTEALGPMMRDLAYLKSHALRLKSAIKHRAKYWTTFEEVEQMPVFSNSIAHAAIIHSFSELGDCMLVSVYELSCNRQGRLFLKTLAKPSDILINRILSVDGILFVLQVNSGPKSRITMHVYNYATSSFDVAASIRAPGILEAQAEYVEGTVWVVARLGSRTLVVRYEPWAEPRKYYLPASRMLGLTLLPETHELVLFRNDGIWRLDGLAGLRRVFSSELAEDWDWAETLNCSNERGNQTYVKLGCTRCNRTLLIKPRYVGV